MVSYGAVVFNIVKYHSLVAVTVSVAIEQMETSE